MGLFSSSKSSSSSTYNTTENNDASILQAGQLGLDIGDGSTATVNALDAGAINSAFGFASKLSDSYSQNWQQLTGAMNITQNGVKDSLDRALRVTAEASNRASEDTRRAFETANGSLNTNTLMIVGAAIAAIILLLRRKK